MVSPSQPDLFKMPAIRRSGPCHCSHTGRALLEPRPTSEVSSSAADSGKNIRECVASVMGIQSENVLILFLDAFLASLQNSHFAYCSHSA